ncbi:unnamed protein product [Acanthoscelides obtectus]|nr:unnamed protein product [Acanthoscelides obtectus]CAK1663547.1 hypothetical protein AOBTE_LOCUS23722 [Acanthoscelides obtectus]
MEKKTVQFQRYAELVENELELLIFSMFDLIDSKVKTLRKLMKFHMHIKRVTTLSSLKKMGLARSKFKNANLPPYPNCYSTESEEMYSLLPNKGSFDASEIRTSEIRDLSSDDNADHVKQALPNDSLPTIVLTDDNIAANLHTAQKNSNQNSSSITTEQDISKDKFEEDGTVKKKFERTEGTVEKSKNTEQAFKEKSEENDGNFKEKTETNEGITKDESKESQSADSKDSNTNAIAKDTTDGIGDSSVLLTHDDKYTSYVTKTDTMDTISDDERNDTDNSGCDGTTNSTANYVAVRTLEGALNSLHDCHPGDSGVFLDGNTFKHVVDILQTVLNTCCQKKRLRCSSLERQDDIEKCRTQPTFKMVGGEVPVRISSSVADCKKYVIRQ